RKITDENGRALGVAISGNQPGGIPEQPRGAVASERSEERGGRAAGNGAVTGTGAGGACRPHPGYGHPASVARNDSTNPEARRSPSARSGGGPGGSAGGCSARAAGQ